MVQQAAIVSRMPTTETHMYILVINYVSRQAARKLGKPVEALRRHRSRHHLLPDAPP
jgi:hypothetical protein